MKILVKAKCGAKENKIRKISDEEFEVFTREQPIENRANKSIAKLLAEYFNISPTSIELIWGAKSKQKILEINT